MSLKNEYSGRKKINEIKIKKRKKGKIRKEKEWKINKIMKS